MRPQQKQQDHVAANRKYQAAKQRPPCQKSLNHKTHQNTIDARFGHLNNKSAVKSPLIPDKQALLSSTDVRKSC